MGRGLPALVSELLRLEAQHNEMPTFNDLKVFLGSRMMGIHLRISEHFSMIGGTR